jgi:hypothetical protein
MIKRLGKLSRFFSTSKALAKEVQPLYGELHIELVEVSAYRACRDKLVEK